MKLDKCCFLFLQTKLYRTVVEDVINNVRENFLDEGVDDQVLQELKQVGMVLTIPVSLILHGTYC